MLEELLHHQPVARIVIPAQDAWAQGKAEYVEKLPCNPAHALAAHRLLGSLDRARMHAYTVLSAKRQAGLGTSLTPLIDDFPA